MAKKRALTKREHDRILKLARAKTPRARIAEQVGVPVSVVGKVACAAGLVKTKKATRDADAAIVRGWLAAGRPARPRSRKSAA